MNLLVISIYKFCRKEILSNYQENFRGQHLGEFQQERRNCFIWTLFLCFNVPYSKVFRNLKVLISNWLLNSKIFVKTDFLVQPPGEPQEQHLGPLRIISTSFVKSNFYPRTLRTSRTTSRWSSTHTKFHKTKWPERVNILWRLFRKNVERSKR